MEILNYTWNNEDKHKKGKTDVFRMSGKMETPVTLKLTMKGYNYLVEQYPLAIEQVNRIGENEYIFNHWYTNYQGISKFILSIMDEVYIISPEILRDYMNNKIKNKVF